jgi:hypothetical protein
MSEFLLTDPEMMRTCVVVVSLGPAFSHVQSISIERLLPGCNSPTQWKKEIRYDPIETELHNNAMRGVA